MRTEIIIWSTFDKKDLKTHPINKNSYYLVTIYDEELNKYFVDSAQYYNASQDFSRSGVIAYALHPEPYRELS